MPETVLKPAEIVDRIHSGDSSAEAEFIKRYSRSLFLMLLKQTGGDAFAANECTQKALLVTLEKMRSGEIREPEKLSAFLRQTAVNVSANYYHQQNRFVAWHDKNVIDVGTTSNTVEIEIYSQQIRPILKEVLNMLPMSRDREILEGYFLLEQPKKEICERLDLSSDHFDRVLFRAKKRLREILEKNRPLEAFLHNEISEKADGHE